MMVWASFVAPFAAGQQAFAETNADKHLRDIVSAAGARGAVRLLRGPVLSTLRRPPFPGRDQVGRVGWGGVGWCMVDGGVSLIVRLMFINEMDESMRSKNQNTTYQTLLTYRSHLPPSPLAPFPPPVRILVRSIARSLACLLARTNRSCPGFFLFKFLRAASAFHGVHAAYARAMAQWYNYVTVARLWRTIRLRGPFTWKPCLAWRRPTSRLFSTSPRRARYRLEWSSSSRS